MAMSIMIRVLAIMPGHNGIIWGIIGVLQILGIIGHNQESCTPVAEILAVTAQF